MRISDWSSDVCSSDLDGAELPGTDVQCVERWKLERTQIWIGFYRRVSRVTRKDSLTTAEFRVDANIGVAIETAHRLFERRRIESDFRRQFGNRRCFDDIASPDPRLDRKSTRLNSSN